MGENSKIEWTDHTFNPWVGCQKVSAGCANCYAETMMTRKTRWANAWGPPATSERIRTTEAYWRKPLAWNRKAAESGTRPRVFCASLADVFEDNPVLEETRMELWTLIEATPNLDWMLLTKRPQNVLRFIPALWELPPWPTNVWLGVSVEDQATADERIPLLLQIPAAVRFVSAEPLLGEILFRRWMPPSRDWPDCGIHWVIAGGESGPNARPMHPDWVRSIRDQCHNAGIAFHFKQWGAWAPNNGFCDSAAWFSAPKYLMSPLGPAGSVPADLLGAGDVLMARVGKRAAGRLLDGQTWGQFPQ